MVYIHMRYSDMLPEYYVKHASPTVKFLLLTWQQDVMDNIIFLFKYPPATIKLRVIPVSRINKTAETNLPQA
jgi:hypothetical protein